MTEATYLGDLLEGRSADPIGIKLAKRGSDGNILMRRWGGCWIDLAVLAAIILIPTLLDSSWGMVIGMIGTVAYFPVMEMRWGRTVGKFATGTIVIDRNGRRPRFWQILVRTVFRLIEVNPFFVGGLPAGIAVLCTATNQRVGDLAAGTYVVVFDQFKRHELQQPVVEASVFD